MNNKEKKHLIKETVEKRHLKALKKIDQNKFNVLAYCKMAQIHRCTFYRKYRSKAYFFLYILETDLRNSMTLMESKRIEDALMILLKVIYEEYELYHWIYKRLDEDDRLMIKEKLSKQLKDFIRLYANLEHGISNSQLHRIGENIYDQLFSLVVHNCSKTILDAYTCMKHLLPVVKGHRCRKVDNTEICY